LEWREWFDPRLSELREDVMFSRHGLSADTGDKANHLFILQSIISRIDSFGLRVESPSRQPDEPMSNNSPQIPFFLITTKSLPL
jgi:hypothetical protein